MGVRRGISRTQDAANLGCFAVSHDLVVEAYRKYPDSSVESSVATAEETNVRGSSKDFLKAEKFSQSSTGHIDPSVSGYEKPANLSDLPRLSFENRYHQQSFCLQVI